MADVYTITTRLRELMEDATPGPVHIGGNIKTVDGWRVNLWNQSGEMVAQLLKKGDADLYEELRNNAPTIIRLLEAVDGAEKALERIANHTDPHGDVELPDGSEQDVALFAQAALATLRAAREGAL